MLSFRAFLLEDEISDIRGKMHENLVHYMLNGNKHAEPEHEAEHNMLKSKMSEKEYGHAQGRAAHAVEHIKKNIIGNKPVSHIQRTSKAGQTGESQRDNPSDLVVHYKNGEKHGLSLKVSQKKNANVPSSNPGAGTIQKITGLDTAARDRRIRSALEKRHPELQSAKSDKERKSIIRSNPEIQKTSKRISNLYLKNTARKQAARIGALPSEERANLIKREILRGAASHPVSTVTSGGEGDYSTVHKDHSTAFNHILNDHKNITHRVSGNSITFSHPKHGDFATLRYKYESEPLASSVKTAGALKRPKKQIPVE